METRVSMGRGNSGRRPSARAQQRQARGLLVVAGLLCLALVGGVAGLFALVSAAESTPAPAPAEDGFVEILQDDEAPAEPEAPADERAADLALDPEKQTEWKLDGTGEKTVYLTFDDGPSDNTPRVLEVLERYGINATFFVTGHEPDKAHYIKDAYEAGNSIGLHSMTHNYDQIYVSEEAFFSDLEAVGNMVKEQIGYVPYLTRFPGGASNTISANYCPGIMSALVNDVQARGYQFYDWNVSSGDASGTNVPVETLVSGSCVEGYTNVMLLFHDSNTKDTTPEALPQIIQDYLDPGYKFEPITREASVCHHGVNN